jgi:hypothetical protein
MLMFATLAAMPATAQAPFTDLIASCTEMTKQP